jgi:hypothetical protein
MKNAGHIDPNSFYLIVLDPEELKKKMLGAG